MQNVLLGGVRRIPPLSLFLVQHTSPKKLTDAQKLTSNLWMSHCFRLIRKFQELLELVSLVMHLQNMENFSLHF